jgi:hypothetical protein
VTASTYNVSLTTFFRTSRLVVRSAWVIGGLRLLVWWASVDKPAIVVHYDSMWRAPSIRWGCALAFICSSTQGFLRYFR